MSQRSNPLIRETGKRGLTSLVRDYLKLAEKLYPIYWARNHQTLGSDRGRPDFEIGFKYGVSKGVHEWRTHVMEMTFVELKSPKKGRKLNEHQRRHAERIERAGGSYYIIMDILELHQLFLDRGYNRITPFGVFNTMSDLATYQSPIPSPQSRKRHEGT